MVGYKLNSKCENDDGGGCGCGGGGGGGGLHVTYLCTLIFQGNVHAYCEASMGSQEQKTSVVPGGFVNIIVMLLAKLIIQVATLTGMPACSS